MGNKIVINSCFGGFSLSDAAIIRYAELNGMNLYPEPDRFGLTTWWKVPPEMRVKELPGKWHEHPLDVRQKYNREYSDQVVYCRDIARDDATLVQVVLEMGKSASGKFASLKVVEIPADVEWEIDEYDGNETVREKHRTWT